MDFTINCPTTFKLGDTVDNNSNVFEDCFIADEGEGPNLEGFLTVDIPDAEEPEEWKIVSIIEDDCCVTARFDFVEDNAWFLGIPIGLDQSLSLEETAAEIRKHGHKVIVQQYDLVLTDAFITIEPGECICYWDKSHYTREDFLEETVEP